MIALLKKDYYAKKKTWKPSWYQIITTRHNHALYQAIYVVRRIIPKVQIKASVLYFTAVLKQFLVNTLLPLITYEHTLCTIKYQNIKDQLIFRNEFVLQVRFVDHLTTSVVCIFYLLVVVYMLCLWVFVFCGSLNECLYSRLQTPNADASTY